MPNNNENNKTCKTFSAQTSKLENGEAAIENVVLKNVPKPLFILFAFGGGGAADFLKAANNKQRRLLKKYPDAEIRIIKGFEHPSEFKEEWTKLYNELTQTETACKYALWQIHYFGHGGEDYLIFRHSAKVFFNKEDNMEPLPWHPNQGILVLHSCRGGAFEDTCDKEKIKQQICLAKVISEQQKTRCLGQVTYGNFAANMDEAIYILEAMQREGIPLKPLPLPENTAEQYKYRPGRITNYIASLVVNKALWGYALDTGDTNRKTLKLKTKYEEALLKQTSTMMTYPIYEEIKKLAPKNQILPCRVFNKGKLEARIVEVDVFNQNDLEYI